jgi:CheY-like chemotaxis protein
MIRSLIVDDAPIVRKGIRLLLQEEHDIEIIGEAGDGPEAITRITRYLREQGSRELVLVGIRRGQPKRIDFVVYALLLIKERRRDRQLIGRLDAQSQAKRTGFFRIRIAVWRARDIELRRRPPLSFPWDRPPSNSSRRPDQCSRRHAESRHSP